MHNFHSLRHKGIGLLFAALWCFFGAPQLSAQTFPPAGFTLPAGKTIVITYDVQVKNDACPPGNGAPAQICNQAVVSGNNFANVPTDDPDTGAANDPTCTPFASLTLGGLIFKDQNCNGLFNSGTDPTASGVTLNLYLDDGDGALDAGDALQTTGMSGVGGVYAFTGLCPGNYIVEIAPSNFGAGQPLEGFSLSAPGNPDPDNDVKNDDNSDNVAGFGIASLAITLDYQTETLGDEDGDSDTNLTLDFGTRGAGALVINEVDSDTDGTDMLEFVELFDGGTGNACLDGFVLVFFNGAGDVSYRAIDLDGYSTNANGYFVAGNPGVSGVDVTFPNGTLQNGADAVALYLGNSTDFPNGTAVTTTNLVDAIVYDNDNADDAGLLVLLNAGQPQANENANGNSACQSLQRIPNGGGGQRNSNTFVPAPPTPDTENMLPQVSIAVSPASINEDAAGTLDFTVSRSGSTDCSMTVNFTVGGTATFNSDYTQTGAAAFTASTGSVTIPVGSSMATVSIDPVVDATVENDETVVLTLQTNAAYQIGSPDTQTGTITNDDQATLTLTAFDADKAEGTGAGSTILKFRATLNNAVQGGFQANYQTNDGSATLANSDYTDNDGFLTFAGTAGEFHDIDVVVTRDANVEPDETIQTEILGLSLAGVDPLDISIAGSPQTGHIRNDDQATLTLTAFDADKAEGTGAGTTILKFRATLDVAVQGGFQANYQTNNGTATLADADYTDNDGFLTFAGTAGEFHDIDVIVSRDSKVELDETVQTELVSLSLLSVNPLTISIAGSPQTGHIRNDDQCVISFANQPFSGTEGQTGTQLYTLYLTFSNEVDIPFNLRIQHTDGTALFADNDYLNPVLVFPVGSTVGQIDTDIPVIVGDTKMEPDEQFNVLIDESDFFGRNIVFAGGMASMSAPVTILNDDIDFGDAPDPTYPTLLASNGARHNGSNLKLGNLNDGDSNGQPTATANGDDTDADGDDEDGVALPATLVTNTMADITVNASGAGRLDAWVDFNANGSFADPGEQIFASQIVAAGNNPLNFNVPPGAVPGNTFARFRLSSAGGLSFTGLAPDGEVEDYQVGIVNTQFSINDPSVVEGSGGTTNLNFTISRSNNASDCSVDYAITGGTATTADGDYQVLAAGTAVFTAGGSTMFPVAVVVNGDQKVELNETVVITLTNPVNGSILDDSGTGTIENDDAAVLTLTSPSIAEGDAGTANLVFDITMNYPADANVSFNFATQNGSATTGDNDYQPVSSAHTLTPGQLQKTVSVPVVGDCNIEPDEQFALILSNLNANGRSVTFQGGGATLNGTGSILTDDALPQIVFEPEYCMKDAGPVIGVANTQTGVSYQLQDAGGNNLGAPLPGNGGSIYFGCHPNADYRVVATGPDCAQTATATVNGTQVACSIVIPDFCSCNSPDGRSTATLKVNAPANQNWTVKAVIGLYDAASPAPPAAPTPLAIGTALNYIGGEMYTLEVLRLNDKGYWVQLTNGKTDLDVQVGNASW
ncbi:MAG: Calx-beta domain-containing protein [Saprospiraceae bacterium]